MAVRSGVIGRRRVVFARAIQEEAEKPNSTKNKTDGGYIEGDDSR